MEARKTSRDMPPAAPAAPQRRAGAARAMRARPPPVRLRSDGSDPGPESLASVLEPTPGPEARLPPEALASHAGTAAHRARSPCAPIARGRRATSSSAPRSASCCWSRSSVAGQKNAPNAPAPQPPPGGTDADAVGSACRCCDEGEIGAGGTATVRKMYDPSLRRRVAMKTLSAELAGNPRAHRDFVQEAEITAQLEHPNIIPIHELAMVDGRASFSMRLIRGQNLREAMSSWSSLRRSGRPLPRAQRVPARLRRGRGSRTAAASSTATSSRTT